MFLPSLRRPSASLPKEYDSLPGEVSRGACELLVRGRPEG